jgi:hypothetical protein
VADEHQREAGRLGWKAALDAAQAWFGPDQAPWVRLTRVQVGWMAWVEEPPAGPGELVGRPVAVVGPTASCVRSYPPGPPASVGRAHERWLERGRPTPAAVPATRTIG